MADFTWNGQQLVGHEGDTAAEALARNGIFQVSVTRKRHRPLGLSGSFVQGALAQIDGTPNVRLDQVGVQQGMRIQPQNTWPGPRLDLLQAFRFIPERWVRGGFEHPRLLPSGHRLFESWERLLSFLAGEGTLAPEFPDVTVIPGSRLQADAVVIGGGPAGRREANALARHGRSVLLISRHADRSSHPADTANPLEPLAGPVKALFGYEAFGIYRGGRLIGAAPLDAGKGAVAVETAELVIATGKFSCPPVVPGNELPGVMDAATAIRLVVGRGIELGRIVVLGTRGHEAVADRLRTAGASIAAIAPITDLQRIIGKSRVRAVDIGRRVVCEAVVHAGPWVSDPNLLFQATADGVLRLGAGSVPGHVRLAGSAAEPDEPIHVCDLAEARFASICACMDVMGAEVIDLMSQGMEHVEELKRQSSCGMGPCQGFPCWEMLGALMAKASGGRLGSDRPSHRPPRRAITVAQAAGLADLVEPVR